MEAKAGLTRRELGDRLGLSYATIEQWGRDMCKPQLKNMRKLERLVGQIDASKGTAE